MEPEWKREKEMFQERVEKQRDKLRGVKNRQPTIPEIMMKVCEWKGVWNRPRITKADKEGNMRSLNRKMENRLYLIVKRKPIARAEGPWEFVPASQWKEGETLRDTVERSAQEKLPNCRVWVVSNAPDVHYQNVCDNGELQDMFYFRSYLVEGKVKLSDEFEDYAWVTKREMARYMEPELYAKVKDLLVDW